MKSALIRFQSILQLPIQLIAPPRSAISKRFSIFLPFSSIRFIPNSFLQRQGFAYILARQAVCLLQRTQLNVTITCQAWHAKNARHMLLDIVDYVEPTMVIVGSRGVGKLQG